MITASEFRNGVTFEMDGQVYQVIEFQHVKPGKGAAFVRAKIKNLKTGSLVERTFNPSDKFEVARMERKSMQFLYKDQDLFYFMDLETFDQTPLNSIELGDSMTFVKENESVQILSYKNQVFGVEAPNFVVLEIIQTEPGFAGNTATNTTKPAIVETGAQIRVPLFVNIGDHVRIDTRIGEYMERA
ncbi:MAG: elongation factor P [Clostridia bacterium]